MTQSSNGLLASMAKATYLSKEFNEVRGECVSRSRVRDHQLRPIA